jgi:hypothetical protein
MEIRGEIDGLVWDVGSSIDGCVTDLEPVAGRVGHLVAVIAVTV